MECVQLCALAMRADVPWLAPPGAHPGSGGLLALSWLQVLTFSAPMPWSASLQRDVNTATLGVVLLYMLVIGLFIELQWDPSAALAPIIYDLLPGVMFLPISNRLLAAAVAGSEAAPTWAMGPLVQTPDALPSALVSSLCGCALLFYSSTAIFLSSYRSDEVVSRSDVVFPPISRVEERSIKAVLSVLVVALGRYRFPQLLVATALTAALLVSVSRNPPCSWRSVNRFRKACLVLALTTLAAGTLLASPLVSGHEDDAAIDRGVGAPARDAEATRREGMRVIVLLAWALVAVCSGGVAALFLSRALCARGGCLLYAPPRMRRARGGVGVKTVPAATTRARRVSVEERVLEEEAVEEERAAEVQAALVARERARRESAMG